MPENKPEFRIMKHQTQTMLPRVIKDMVREITSFKNTVVDYIEWEWNVDYAKKRYKIHTVVTDNNRKKNKVIYFIDLAGRKYTGFSVDLQFNQTSSKWRDLMSMIRILSSPNYTNKTQSYINRDLSERVMLIDIVNAMTL